LLFVVTDVYLLYSYVHFKWVSEKNNQIHKINIFSV